MTASSRRPQLQANQPFLERHANLGHRPTSCVAHGAPKLASGGQREAEVGGRPRRRGGDGDRLGGVTVGADLEHMLARRQALHDGDPLGIGLESPLDIGAQQANRGLGERAAVGLRLQRDANATGRGGAVFEFVAEAGTLPLAERSVMLDSEPATISTPTTTSGANRFAPPRSGRSPASDWRFPGKRFLRLEIPIGTITANPGRADAAQEPIGERSFYQQVQRQPRDDDARRTNAEG